MTCDHFKNKIILRENTFKTCSLQNRKKNRELNFGEMIHLLHMSHAMCHVSDIMCHMSRVICHMSLFLLLLCDQLVQLMTEGLLSRGLTLSSFQKLYKTKR